MPRVFRSDSAKADIKRILRDLAAESVSASIRFQKHLKDQCAFYASMPDIGILRDDLVAGLRCFTIWSFLIFYRRIEDGIELVRAIHGHRDIDPSFFISPEQIP